ncbi:hypothetical protein K8Q94_03045 [Candidatus Nomurabacteria bacterium]|nr:hypothetical protein [Candidatus Nomurabacteria bacterium]
MKSVSFKDADNKEVKKETSLKDIIKPMLDSKTKTVKLNEEFNIKLGEKVIIANDSYSGATFKVVGFDLGGNGCPINSNCIAMPFPQKVLYEIQTNDVKNPDGSIQRGALYKNDPYKYDSYHTPFSVLVKETDYQTYANIVLGKIDGWTD